MPVFNARKILPFDFESILKNPEEWSFELETMLSYYTNSFYPQSHHSYFIALICQQGFFPQATELLHAPSLAMREIEREHLFDDYFHFDVAILLLRYAPSVFDLYLEFFFKYFDSSVNFEFGPSLAEPFAKYDELAIATRWNKLLPLLKFLHPSNFPHLEDLSLTLYSTNYSFCLQYFLPYLKYCTSMLPEYTSLFKFYPEQNIVSALNLCHKLDSQFQLFIPIEDYPDRDALFRNIMLDDLLCSKAFLFNYVVLLEFCDVDAVRKRSPHLFF